MPERFGQQPDELKIPEKIVDEQKVSEEEVLGLYANEQEKMELEHQADEVLDYLLSTEQDDYQSLNHHELSEKLGSIPENLKVEVFKRWLAKYPDLCMEYLEFFGNLPNDLQDDITQYFQGRSAGLFSCRTILSVFNTIENPELEKIILEEGGFKDLMENRSKLPNATEEQLLKRAWHEKKDGYKYFDYDSVVPYLDQLPSLDKQEVIQECSTGLLIESREKLELSFRQLLDILYKRGDYEGLVAFLDMIDPEYHQEIADKLLGDDVPLLLKNAKYFKQIDVPKILNEIYNDLEEAGMGDAKRGLGVFLGYLSNMDEAGWLGQMPKEMIDRIVDIYPSKIAIYASRFGEDIDRPRLIENLFKRGEFTFLINNAKELDLQLDKDFINRVIDAGGEESVILYIETFGSGVLSRDIFFKLFDLHPERMSDKIKHFSGFSRDDAYSILKTPLHGRQSDIPFFIISNYTIFKDLKLDKDFADFLFNSGNHYQLIESFDKFEGVDYKELFGKCIEAEKQEYRGRGYRPETRISYMAQNIDNFKGIEKDREIGIQLFQSLLAQPEWSLEKIDYVNNFYKPLLDKVFEAAYDIFGSYLTSTTYETITKIASNSFSKEELRKLGITRGGKDGLNQLRERVLKFKSEILEEDFDAAILEESDFYKEYLKSYVRFEDSEWGGHDDYGFTKHVKAQRILKDKGEIIPLKEEYQPSGEVKIKKIDKEKQDEFKPSKDIVDRYTALQDSLRQVNLSGDKKFISTLIRGVAIKRDNLLLELQEKALETQNPKAIVNLEQKIEKLKGLDLRSIKNFENNFTALSQFREFHSDLRELTFYYALKKHKDFRIPAFEFTLASFGSDGMEKVSFEKNIGPMVNFVNHIVNEETWSEYFKNKEAMKAFKNITDVRVLEDGLAKWQNQATKGMVPFEFVPTRGLLMEFSGHIADACWASKYLSIAKEFPNFSATIMVQNKGNKSERLAGASMMIETEAEDGTKLLVIRGLNPIENVINAVQVEDFFEKFVGYAKGIAEKTDRKLAIVIDNHCGGSGTNRPVLFEFLDKKRKTLKRVALKSEEDTTFNGYDITGDTYFIE